MNKPIRSNKVLWIFLFLFTFSLTQIHLVLNFSSGPRWLGLPGWLWLFAGFHLLFIGTLYWFIQSQDDHQ